MHPPSPLDLPALSFPPLPLRVQPLARPVEVYDPVRKRFLPLTPEEWVRQHLLLFLHLHRGYPLSLVAVEQRLSSQGSSGQGVKGSRRRFDLAMFHPSAPRTPALLAECKAPGVAISARTIAQAGAYAAALRAPILILTNGITHHCLRTVPPAPMADIPHFSAISNFLAPDMP
jgi:hypothetical protein